MVTAANCVLPLQTGQKLPSPIFFSTHPLIHSSRIPVSLEITPTELKARLDKGEPLQIIDVREDMEWEFCNIGGLHIPLADLPKNLSKVPAQVPVVLVCHHGVRSGQALRYLSSVTGQTNFLNLKGGIHAWALQVDPEMPQY